MDLGPFDRKVRLLAPPAGKDADYGTPSGQWTTFAEPWANILEILPSKATEAASDQSRIAKRPTRVRLRYLDGVTSAMRLQLIDRGGRLLKIVTPPVELGRRAALEFMAEDFSTSGDAS